MNVMDLPRVVECPAGRNFPEGSPFGKGKMCHYIKDNVLHICNAYMSISGKHPQKDEQFNDSWDCAITWNPLMALEGARTNRGQTQAIEKLHKTVSDGNKKAEEILHGSIHSTVRQVIGEMMENGQHATFPRQ